MKVRFTTKHVSGKGRGKLLGYPTINMEIPPDLGLADGIYAVWVTIEGIRFMGALHYGPIPTFDDEQKSLEVFLLGVADHDLDNSDTSSVTIELVKRLRDVKKFDSVDALTQQIERDVLAVRHELHEIA